MAKTNWLKLTQEAYEASSAYLDSNYRPDFDYSIKAFRSEHAGGSKYLSPEYMHRSRIFRPKTRSIIRKNEAAAAAALWSNLEVADFTPGNPDNPTSVAGTAAMKEVVEYRMKHSIPSFEICMGGIQDAQVQGAVISFQYWEYQKKNGKVVKDKPCIDLRPIENIRLDGGALWTDPINTSPYLFDILPMYVCDVKAMMNSTDEKTGQPKWKKFDDKVIEKARPDRIDSTRQARLGKQVDPEQETTGIGSFDIVWVFRVFMKDEEGDDYTYYTLGTEELLTDPKPREEVYHHSKFERPYVMGYAILETHKAIKSSVPVLIKPLQQETNEVRNQRLDNVKFVLNKRWIVARGRQVDVQSLVRNVPGGVTLTTDPKNDVQESNWADVTSSAYVEEDRINADLDDVAGNFSPSTKVANNAVNDTLGGSKLAAMGAGVMTDYLLRTIIETWWEKVLRQLVSLEQAYETDEVILAVCAEKARLFPRFGISRLTDDLLEQEVHLSVNVGMGASNPNERLQKFLMASNAVVTLANTAPPGFNIIEASKEIYGNAGYRDGARFMGQQDPRLMKAMQMVQQLTEALKGKQMEFQSQAGIEQMKLQSAERQTAAQLQADYFRVQGDLRIREAEIAVQKAELQLEWAKAQIEMKGASEELQLKVMEAQKKLEHEEVKLQAMREKAASEIAQTQMEMQATAQETQHRTAQSALQLEAADLKLRAAKEESKNGEKIDKANSEMKSRMDKQEMASAQMGQALALILGGLQEQSKKKKASGFRLKKSGGKTTAVVIEHDDGSEQELPVKAA